MMYLVMLKNNRIKLVNGTEVWKLQQTQEVLYIIEEVEVHPEEDKWSVLVRQHAAAYK